MSVHAVCIYILPNPSCTPKAQEDNLYWTGHLQIPSRALQLSQYNLSVWPAEGLQQAELWHTDSRLSGLSSLHTFGWAPWWKEKTWRKWSSTWGAPVTSMISITGRNLRCCGGPLPPWTRRKTFTRPHWWKSVTPNHWLIPETPVVSMTASRYDSSTLGLDCLWMCGHAYDASPHTATRNC